MDRAILLSSPPSPSRLLAGGRWLAGGLVALAEPLAVRLARGRRRFAVEEGPDLVVYDVAKNRLKEIARSRGGEEAATGSGRRPRTAELRLDPALLLQRRLQLPAGGREYLEPIVEHRIDRLTPWKRENLVYGFAAGSVVGEEIAVDILATSRDILDARRRRLSALGFTASAVGSADEPQGAPLRIDLLRGTGDEGRQRLRRAIVLAGTVVPLLLLLAAGASAWLAADAQSRLSALEASLVERRRAMLAGAQDDAATRRALELIEIKAARTPHAVLIDRLARVIPDHTFLGELEIGEAAIRLVGLSGDAPSLIGLLEGEEGLEGAAFAAPVARDEDGRDRFDIAVQRPATVPGEESGR